MSSNSRLYPYHPISGDRLAGTFEVIPAWVPREIHKTGDTITLEDGSETLVNWNGQELLQINNQLVLVTEGGDTCLNSEAIWSEQDTQHIEVTLPGPASSYPTNNTLMHAYVDLHVAASCALHNLQQGDIEGALKQLQGQLNAILDVDRLTP
ncbi:TPA: hypothetical protein ACYRLJ_000338 [Pseudomonas aeruginosa]